MGFIGDTLNFIGKYILNWKVLLFIFIQSIITFNMSKKWYTSLLLFLYTFIVFLYFCPCPVRSWFNSMDVRLTLTILVVFLYSTYIAFVPFYYPRKKSSYFIFQYISNLVIYYIVFFLLFYFCKDYSTLSPDLGSFYTQYKFLQ